MEGRLSLGHYGPSRMGRSPSRSPTPPAPWANKPASSPWSSCLRSGRTARSSCAARPAPAWTGTCQRSGPSPFPPWRHRQRSAGWASETASAGSGSRPECCGWNYWQCCRGTRNGVQRAEEERQSVSDCRPGQSQRAGSGSQDLGLGRTREKRAQLRSLHRSTAAGQKRAVVSM